MSHVAVGSPDGPLNVPHVDPRVKRSLRYNNPAHPIRGFRLSAVSRGLSGILAILIYPGRHVTAHAATQTQTHCGLLAAET